jgi:hypothetical protein
MFLYESLWMTMESSVFVTVHGGLKQPEAKRCIRCRIICWTLDGVRRQSSGVISGLGQVCGSGSINLRLPNQRKLFTVFLLPSVNGYNEINILIRPENKEVRGLRLRAIGLRVGLDARQTGQRVRSGRWIGLSSCDKRYA